MRPWDWHHVNQVHGIHLEMQEFTVMLGYVVSSRLAWSTQRTPAGQPSLPKWNPILKEEKRTVFSGVTKSFCYSLRDWDMFLSHRWELLRQLSGLCPCPHAWSPELDAQNPCRRRELAPETHFLTSRYILWHTCAFIIINRQHTGVTVKSRANYAVSNTDTALPIYYSSVE